MSELAALVSDEAWHLEQARLKIRFRMDPKRAPDWSFWRGPPIPFWFDPTRQVAYRQGEPDGMLWTWVPINDPTWAMT